MKLISQKTILFLDTRRISSSSQLAPCPTIFAPKLASSIKLNRETLVTTYVEHEEKERSEEVGKVLK